jgi:hypothetical protein
MMGEVANVQLLSPEIVTGYIVVFDTAQDRSSVKHGKTWCEVLDERLARVSGRRPPAWGTGMVEASCLIQVDFSASPKLLTAESMVKSFLATLAGQVKLRNPEA